MERFPERLKMYKEGMDDGAIAEKVGRTRPAIAAWRKRRGSPANKPKIRPLDWRSLTRGIGAARLVRIPAQIIREMFPIDPEKELEGRWAGWTGNFLELEIREKKGQSSRR